MSAGNYDAVINLKANDQATPKVDSATKNILDRWRVMRQEIKSTRAEFELQNRNLVVAGQAFNAVGRVAGSMMNIYNQYNLMQLRVTESNQRLTLAQLNYNRVLSEQGPGTEEAIRASIELQNAKNDVAKATRDETLGYIGMAFELGSTVSLMISSIPKIQQFIKQMQGAKAVAAETAAVTAGTTTVATTTAVASGATTGTTVAGVGAGVRGTSGLKTAVRGGGIVAGGAIGADILDQLFPQNPVTKFRTEVLQPMVDAFHKDLGERFGNLFAGKGFVPNSPESGQVEHVVTLKIENATDHKITAIEKSFGIEQVMGSNQ